MKINVQQNKVYI